jgi:hypothetical protein
VSPLPPFLLLITRFGRPLLSLLPPLAILLTAVSRHMGFPARRLLQPDDRRIAEVQYKRCCALQFAGDAEASLPAVQVRATAGWLAGWLGAQGTGGANVHVVQGVSVAMKSLHCTLVLLRCTVLCRAATRCAVCSAAAARGRPALGLVQPLPVVRQPHCLPMLTWHPPANPPCRLPVTAWCCGNRPLPPS